MQEPARQVTVNRRHLDALVEAHQRGKLGYVDRYTRNVELWREAQQLAKRRASFDALAMEHERKKMMREYTRKYAERNAHPAMILPSGQLHASQITAKKIYAGSMHSGYRSPGYSQHLTAQMSGMQPSMIVTSNRPPSNTNTSDSNRHGIVGAKYAAASISAVAMLGIYAALPLWAVAAGLVLLLVALYLAIMVDQVCQEMIPVSEVEQRKIDWIVNRELPALPEPSYCLDCSKTLEECICEKDKPRKWAAPCEAAVQAMGDPSNDCIMCGFPVQDH